MNPRLLLGTQQALRSRGYQTSELGEWGTQDTASLSRFRRDHDLGMQAPFDAHVLHALGVVVPSQLELDMHQNARNAFSSFRQAKKKVGLETMAMSVSKRRYIPEDYPSPHIRNVSQIPGPLSFSHRKAGMGMLAALAPGNAIDVLTLQQDLDTIGYPVGGEDGAWGPNTAQAVKNFQADNYLTVDGIPGPQTVGKLEEILGAGPAAQEGPGATPAPLYVPHAPVGQAQVAPAPPTKYDAEPVMGPAPGPSPWVIGVAIAAGVGAIAILASMGKKAKFGGHRGRLPRLGHKVRHA